MASYIHPQKVPPNQFPRLRISKQATKDEKHTLGAN